MKRNIVVFVAIVVTAVFLGNNVFAEDWDFGKKDAVPLRGKEIPISPNALPEQVGGVQLPTKEVPCAAIEDWRFTCRQIIQPAK